MNKNEIGIKEITEILNDLSKSNFRLSTLILIYEISYLSDHLHYVLDQLDDHSRIHVDDSSVDNLLKIIEKKREQLKQKEEDLNSHSSMYSKTIKEEMLSQLQKDKALFLKIKQASFLSAYRVQDEIDLETTIMRSINDHLDSRVAKVEDQEDRLPILFKNVMEDLINEIRKCWQEIDKSFKKLTSLMSKEGRRSADPVDPQDVLRSQGIEMTETTSSRKNSP
jgi:hypothetical protein